jgi:hypothetical protein
MIHKSSGKIPIFLKRMMSFHDNMKFSMCVQTHTCRHTFIAFFVAKLGLLQDKVLGDPSLLSR